MKWRRPRTGPYCTWCGDHEVDCTCPAGVRPHRTKDSNGKAPALEHSSTPTAAPGSGEPAPAAGKVKGGQHDAPGPGKPGDLTTGGPVGRDHAGRSPVIWAIDAEGRPPTVASATIRVKLTPLQWIAARARILIGVR